MNVLSDTMIDLQQDIKHLKGDVQKIHDFLEHLNDHSGICNELVRESNFREASELFNHLDQIDKLVHQVEEHLSHINQHVETDSDEMDEYFTLDIDDLKHDASHITFDLEDIHSHIEHLALHANMCQDIVAPTGQEELQSIKLHLGEIDEKAHELLDHIKSIRGDISAKYSEFIWSVPDGLDDYLINTELLDHNNEKNRYMALKLVDGCSDIKEAILINLCFVRDFIAPESIGNDFFISASNILDTNNSGGILKSILSCALSRAVSIPSRLHFVKGVSKDLTDILSSTEISINDPRFTISWPEFYFEKQWVPAHELLKSNTDLSCYHENLIGLGIPKCNIETNPKMWQKLGIEKLIDDYITNKPEEYLSGPDFAPPPPELDRRLFAGFIYTGELP